ncbi:MAG: hypothetical protein OXT67_11000 [Zetaproteobacteria bacterium]|nr:hypothetical protein [Zetaproteobacteria bacterium]
MKYALFMVCLGLSTVMRGALGLPDFLRQSEGLAPPEVAKPAELGCQDFSGSWLGKCNGARLLKMEVVQHGCERIRLFEQDYPIGGVVRHAEYSDQHLQEVSDYPMWKDAQRQTLWMKSVVNRHDYSRMLPQSLETWVTLELVEGGLVLTSTKLSSQSSYLICHLERQEHLR